MVVDITGVVKLELPLNNKVPPEGASYQLIVPTEAVAPKTTVPASHREAGIGFVTVGPSLIVATTDVLLVDAHPPLVAST